MVIFHVCQYKSRHSNGVQSAVWELAKAHSKLGHDVYILSLGRVPTPGEIDYCCQHGVRLMGVAGRIPRFGALLSIISDAKNYPQVIFHLHSVFIFWHSLLAILLKMTGVCYFISSHGNLAARELRRKHLRKWIYLHILEKRCLSLATGCICASENEFKRVNCLLKQPDHLVVVGNGLDDSQNSTQQRPKASYNSKSGKGLFLGKSDVINKGIDRMFQFAAAFPGGVDFRVVNHNQLELLEEFEALVTQYESNPKVRVLDPVYGMAKFAAFEEASFYLHLARWEVFGMGILEAAMHSLPLIISSDCDIANEAKNAGAAYVVERYDDEGLQELTRWVKNDEAVNLMGLRAREWAVSRYGSATIAEQTLRFYMKNRVE